MPSQAPFELHATGLCCERDDRMLFQNFDLTVTTGAMVQLAGPNGAGKTTLLRILAGLNHDFDGEVRFAGHELSEVYSDYAQQRLYMGHLAAVKKSLTALENLRWLTAQWQLADADLIDALEAVELAGYEDTPCQQLSAGQQRRVSLARLLVVPTPLWILDEPFTALDKQGVAWLEQRICEHVSAGGMVIITSHHALHAVPGLRVIDLDQWAPEVCA
ncbi:heme ABC exporter ATP-binding protein CcmA [Bacterioplanes sanyensis]|uniref:Heme ABC exporter ATP-binding protein CcmA n=1 Tax=Bacterioplanes sanyensis TaxID=1249553 RepID=A0A222FNY1_9GAMM|nr:cytochrome c biogenesis heme-transporting ATPase CcmA [Bacterioplanes sanyensis]ASP40246.1 heme ABC exporter ATP-binding protein CcmA [Bacterioplanes sanyensis]